MRTRILILTALALTLALSAPAAHAQCPAGQFFMDLKNCTTAGLAGVTVIKACAPATVSAACPAAANWKQTVLKLAIPAGCTQANVDVEWEGLPSGWTVNLGDSPTNDGHAGDAGSTANNAEMWILDETFAVANASNNAALINNPVVLQHLSLTDGAMKFVVRNQYLGWGQPYSYLQMPATKGLFAIPDATVPAADQRAVYLGLNRVITDRADRKGCGARRVLVTFK
jgi:hypothetical protein